MSQREILQIISNTHTGFIVQNHIWRYKLMLVKMTTSYNLSLVYTGKYQGLSWEDITKVFNIFKLWLTRNGSPYNSEGVHMFHVLYERSPSNEFPLAYNESEANPTTHWQTYSHYWLCSPILFRIRLVCICRYP